MKFNPAGIVVGVLALFVGMMMASYVWALYHTWIIIFSLAAIAGWVGYSIHKARSSKRNNDEDGNGQGGVHVHFH